MADMIDIDSEKHDTNPLSSPCISILVGTAGNVAVVTEEGEAITLYSVSGQRVFNRPIMQVKNTGTTATGITGIV